MKRRYPFRPLLAPAVIGAITAIALLAALFDDGLIETASVLLLAGLVGLVGLRLVKRVRPRPRG